MRSHGISSILFGHHSQKQGSARRARQAIAVAALAVLSVGCAVSSRVSLPPLPIVAVFDLLAAVLPAGSSGATYGPATVSTNLSTSGTGTVSACQFVSAVGTSPGSNTVPAGLQTNVGTPPGGAPNTGCTISGLIGDANGNGMIDAGEGVAPGTYTFTVRAADSSSPPQSDTQTYTIVVSSLQITVTDSPDPTVTGQNITVTWTFSVSGSPATPNQQALVELLGPTLLVEDSCVANLTALGCGPLQSTTAGAHTVRLTYPNPPATDANFPGTTTATAAHTVNVAPTTTALASNLNPSIFGQNVTFTATIAVTAPGAGTPTGTVTFTDTTTAATLCANVPLAGLSAQCMTAGLLAGTHNVQATFSGDANYATSMSNLVAQVVNQASTTTALISTGNTVFSQPVTFTATVAPVAPGAGTPTGPVNFVDNTLGVSLTGCSAVPLAAGVATCTVNDLAVGSHNVQATYAGDVNFITSMSNTIAHVVSPNTTTTLASGTNPSVFQQTITLTATVAAIAPITGEPTGNVAFFDITAGANVTGCGAVALVAGAPGSNMSTAACIVSDLTVGSHNIRADYAGAGTFSPSTSNIVGQTVNQAATTSNLVSNLNPSIVGDNVTFTATLTVNAPGAGAPIPPGGTYTFVDTTTASNLCVGVAVVAGSAQCMTTALGAGTHNVQATYSGDTNFAGSTSNTVAQMVNQAPSTTNLMSSANPSFSGQTVTFTATVSGAGPVPTGSVTFTNTSCGSVSLTAGVATCMQAFTVAQSPVNVQAMYGGDVNYSASNSLIVAQVILPANTTTTVISSANPSVSGQNVTFTATVAPVVPGAGTPAGNVQFLVNGGLFGAPVALSGGVASSVTTTFTVVGSPRQIDAVYLGSTEFNGSGTAPLNSLSQVTNQSASTVIVTPPGGITVTGQSYLVNVTVGATAPGGGTPTGGPVAVTDGTGGSCNIVALVGGMGSCSITSTTGGTKTLTATYLGDTEFTGNSGTAMYTISAASTTIVVTADLTDPSFSGDLYQIDVLVTTQGPGSGPPTGNFTISDTASVTSCTASVSASGANTSTGFCSLSSRAMGVTTGPNGGRQFALVADYLGNASFAASTDNSELHEVIKGGTGIPTVIITPTPSSAGQAYTVDAAVVVNTGTGTPTGLVTVDDNEGNSCTFNPSVATSCLLTTFTSGAKLIDASYPGDAEFNGASNNGNAHTVLMGIVTTPAAPGGTMGDGVDSRAIGTGTAGVDGVAFEVIGASGGVATCVFGGTPPTGVTVAPGTTSGAADACVMAGAPTQTGTFTFTITVTDGSANMATTSTITWTVNATLAFNALPAMGDRDAVNGRNFNLMISASGGIAPFTVSQVAGMTLANDATDCASFSFSTAAMSATANITATPVAKGPAVGTVNTCNSTVQIVDSASTSTPAATAGTVTQNPDFDVQDTLEILTTRIPNRKRDSNYFGVTITRRGGTNGATGNFIWSATSFTCAGGTCTGTGGCSGLSFPDTGASVPLTGTVPAAAAAACTPTFTVTDEGSLTTASGNDPQAYNSLLLNTFAYAAGNGTNSLEVINTDTNAAVDFNGGVGGIQGIPLGFSSGGPDEVAVSPDGQFVFVSNATSSQIAVVDATTNTAVANSPFAVGATCDGPLGLATHISATGVVQVFAACSQLGANEDERIVRYDFNPAAGGSLTDSATANFTDCSTQNNNDDCSPRRLAITPPGFDCDSNTMGIQTCVVGTFEVDPNGGPVLQGGWGRMDADTGAIILDAGNDEVTLFTTACDAPLGIAIAQTAAAGNPVEAYIACTTAGQVARINLGTNTQAVANIAVGTSPNSIAFTPEANSAFAYVTLNGADQVIVIDTATPAAGTARNLPDPAAAADTNANPTGVTIPTATNASGILEAFMCINGAAGNARIVSLDDSSTAPTASAVNPIGLQTNSAPRGIAHIPIPR